AVGTFALARYNSDGTLDATFGSGGKVTTVFGTNGAVALALALQPDGKIVAAGVTASSTSNFALARYNTNGTLDTSFGSGGKVTTNFSGGNDYARGVAIQADGKIVVAGSSNIGLDWPDFALAR